MVFWDLSIYALDGLVRLWAITRRGPTTKDYRLSLVKADFPLLNPFPPDHIGVECVSTSILVNQP